MMNKAAVSKSMRRLPVTDRIELLDELWHSIAADQRDIPVTEEHKTMIDQSLAEIEKNPGKGMSHAEFKKKLNQLARDLKKRSRGRAA
jgi:putative addiction module component (TIGR02574 family)